MSLQLNTATGIFGPHETITDEGLYYAADGVTYQKSVVGVGVIEAYVEPQEVADERVRRLGKAQANRNFDEGIEVALRSIEGLSDIRLLAALLVIYAEIKAWEANNTVDTPALQRAANTLGLTRLQTAQKIINKYGAGFMDMVEKVADREAALDALP